MSLCFNEPPNSDGVSDETPTTSNEGSCARHWSFSTSTKDYSICAKFNLCCAIFLEGIGCGRLPGLICRASQLNVSVREASTERRPLQDSLTYLHGLRPHGLSVLADLIDIFCEATKEQDWNDLQQSSIRKTDSRLFFAMSPLEQASLLLWQPCFLFG